MLITMYFLLYTSNMAKRMKTGIIYLVHNNVTGKKYVGQSVRTLATRWQEHCKQAESGKGWALQAAIRKYGKENFSVTVLAEAIETSLPQLEVLFIYLHNSIENGYNLTPGGDGVPCTDAMRKKMSLAQSNRLPPSEETRRKISVFHKGKIISPESRLKMRQARIGKPTSQAHRDAISKARLGTRHSEETIAKISSANSGERNANWGKPESEETKAKKSDSLRKHFAANPRDKFSQETRSRMSAAKRSDPNINERMKQIASVRKGKPAANRGSTHSEETKAKMKAYWAARREARAA